MLLVSDFKLYLPAILLLAAEVSAAQISYAGQVNVINPKDGKPSTFSMATKADDQVAEAVLENMPRWTNGQYKTHKDPKTGIVTVTNTKMFANWEEVNSLRAEMQFIINKNYHGSKAKSPSPEAGSSNQRDGLSRKKQRRSLQEFEELLRRELDLWDFYDM